MSDRPLPPSTTDPWADLRRFTQARIALGRVGASQPTDDVLDFSMAHARARDAVHLPLDIVSLRSLFAAAGFSTFAVRSQARDRSEYLRRPDLGRRLHPDCVPTLASGFEGGVDPHVPGRLGVVVADGLSSLASARHAVPFLSELRSILDRQAHSWSLDIPIFATQARVALADEIGMLRGAEAVVILLGERPGLSSPDSLGIYMTYDPRQGRSDADRNCISNVRAEGLSYREAACKLLYLLEQSRLRGKSGVSIKDGSGDDPGNERFAAGEPASRILP